MTNNLPFTRSMLPTAYRNASGKCMYVTKDLWQALEAHSNYCKPKLTNVENISDMSDILFRIQIEK